MKKVLLALVLALSLTACDNPFGFKGDGPTVPKNTKEQGNPVQPAPKG